MYGYTAGPWRLSGPDQFGDYTIQPPDEDLAIAAVVNGSMRDMGGQADVTEANAALIAAAPDTYETLVKLYGAVCEHFLGDREGGFDSLPDRLQEPMTEAFRALGEPGA